MRVIIVLITSMGILLVLSGCGTQKRAQKKAYELRGENQVQPTDQGETRSRRVLYPSNHNPERDFYVDSDAPKGTDTKRRANANQPQVKFSYIESANVRVAGMNPLPPGGVLELDLDRMRDDFCYPYKGEFLSDYGMRSGRMHTGVDIRVVPNDTIRAAFDGVVRMSKMYSSYGNIVVIRHYGGFETVYSHGSKNLVDVNDVVQAGDPIALGGRTGRATTEHLHFEVRAAGEHVDPNKLIDVHGQKLQPGMMYIGQQKGKIVAYSSTQDLRLTQESEKEAAKAQVESQAKAAEKRAVAMVEVEKKTPAPGSQEFYRVQKGETLYGIALRHKTTTKKLCELNNIKETATLQINQKLRVR